MDDARRRGVIIGLLLILYMVGSGAVDFILRGSPAGPVLLAGVLGVLTESFWLAIAVTAYPMIERRNRGLARLFVALAVVILALGVVENVGGAGWAHLVVRMIHGAAMFVFYLALFRQRAIPRLLAGAGLIAALLQIIALAMPFFGGEVVFPLLAPTGVCQLILAIWLIAKGFEPESSPSQEGRTAGGPIG